MNLCPDEIREALFSTFSFPEKPLFAVVSSLSKGGINSRMMRIYDITPKGELILLTHTSSRKWSEFLTNERITLCFVGDNKLTQVILKGEVKLEKKSGYWKSIREDVKMIYDPVYQVDTKFSPHPLLKAPELEPETSGMLRVIPHFWELLKLEAPYTMSTRFQFHLHSTSWQKEQMTLG